MEIYVLLYSEATYHLNPIWKVRIFWKQINNRKKQNLTTESLVYQTRGL